MQLDKDAAIDRTVRQVTGLTLWLGLLLVTYWWVADGGVTDLAHKASELTSLGRLTGLWAADLLLVQVLLMSRLPPLEHAYGRDWLARIHRVVGLLSFYLMISHIVLIIAGHASVQWSAVLSTVWDLIINYGGMLLAVAGTGCLIMVAVTSIKAAWRRLRYESWHLLHLYAYVGVGLAVPHQLWAGQQFLQSTALTSGAARATGNGLLGVVRESIRCRVGLPYRPTVGQAAAASGPVHQRPGRDGHAPTRYRCPSRRTATLRITAKALGEGSARLASLRPGTRVLFEGPYERLSSRARTQRKVVLAGAGVGITPLRALVEGLDYAPGEAIILQRYTAEPLFIRELDVLASRAFRWCTCPANGVPQARSSDRRLTACLS
jgi:predicted ferric reductase